MAGIVTARTGRRVDMPDLQVYAVSDGSLIACGHWPAPDSLARSRTAPLYVRLSADGEVLRVHLDDATGFGPARLGCNQAASGRLAP